MKRWVILLDHLRTIWRRVIFPKKQVRSARKSARQLSNDLRKKRALTARTWQLQPIESHSTKKRQGRIGQKQGQLANGAARRQHQSNCIYITRGEVEEIQRRTSSDSKPSKNGPQWLNLESRPMTRDHKQRQAFNHPKPSPWSQFGFSSIEDTNSKPRRSANGASPPARKSENRGQLDRTNKATTFQPSHTKWVSEVVIGPC